MILKNKQIFASKDYDRRKNIQVQLWKNGELVEFFDNEGYPFNLVLSFEDVEKIYNEMKKLVKTKK